jgi:hypothetical protein
MRLTLGAVITGILLGAVIGAIVGVAIARRGALGARGKEGEVLRLVDVSVTEAEAVLAEPGVDAQYMGAIVPERPVLDITLRNDGHRTEAVVRLELELEGPFRVPALDDLPPAVRPIPGAAITGPLPGQEPRQPPSFSYAVNFPLREGRYAHMVRQALAPGEVDRFVVSLVAQEQAEQGKGCSFYQVTLSLDYGRARNGSRRRVVSEPITVLASHHPGNTSR